MVVYGGAASNREELFDVLDHEWGHMWFPMIVGTDERRHPWMDEGFDTYTNQYSKNAYFPEIDAVLDNTAQYVLIATNVREQPVARAPDLFEDGNEFGLAAYVIPVAAFVVGGGVLAVFLRRRTRAGAESTPAAAPALDPELARIVDRELESRSG